MRLIYRISREGLLWRLPEHHGGDAPYAKVAIPSGGRGDPSGNAGPQYSFLEQRFGSDFLRDTQ
jgi:hypothetical protein